MFSWFKREHTTGGINLTDSCYSQGLYLGMANLFFMRVFYRGNRQHKAVNPENSQKFQLEHTKSNFYRTK